jgi:hypothetical protein
MAGEVSLHLLGLGNHSILPLLPVCGANLTFVSGDELKGLENPLCLDYRTANGEVVYGSVHDYSIRIDEKEPSQGNAFFLHEDTIISRDLLIYVRKERVIESATESPLFSLRIHPGLVDVFGVH